MNYLRKNSKHNNLDELQQEIISSEENPEHILMKKELENELIKLLQKLSIKERSLFYRKYYYMQSTVQIAREMGMTPRAVEGKLYRIKQKLRRQMGGWKYDQ